MKSKVLLVMTVVIMAVMVAVFYNNGRGSLYPDAKEMEQNLLAKGYEVTVEDAEEGDHLDAHNGDEFIELYWMSDSSYADALEKDLSEKYTDKEYGMHILIGNTENGNTILCCSDKARDDAGIPEDDIGAFDKIIIGLQRWYRHNKK
ncbi:MAG: hypothetical protein IK999_18555 [Ruminococcus sp.]|nr:hypothetical protein [Ruminococcus sp.]